METILEQQRRHHEERERIIERMVHVSLNKTEHDQIHTDQCLKHLYELFQEATFVLKELYEDKDETRKNEVAALTGPNEFSEFYFRLKDVKEFYKKHPNEICVPSSVEFEYTAQFLTNQVSSLRSFQFNDEEGSGKYLDLHECYEKYINIRDVEKIDYICYLDSFDQLYDIPKERKNMEYINYLDTLVSYLFNYICKVKPLLDVEKELEKIDNQFAKDWVLGVFPGWPKEYESALANNGAYLDLSVFSNWEELASLGLDRLKSALMALNMKCGGTLEERAQRLFSMKDISLSEISMKVKKHKVKDNMQGMLRQRSIANLEAKIYRWAELITVQRIATKENVQRKQARTVGERENSDGDITDTDDDNDHDSNEEIPYNPKNLPLGWDGKPIPYWLYKLHGLNLSYNCEICGNFTYKGPKSFQRHFAEWRHAHGMRCLRIPNTAHFANITQIEDAILLWEQLKTQKYNEYWIPALEEEFEDSLGNVVNRKTYEDLKRQGLL